MSEDIPLVIDHVGERDQLEEPTFEGCLRSLVPADKAILMNELPQLLEKLSSEKDVQIMTSDQMNIIRMYAEAEPDLEIGLEGLLNMFAQMNPGSIEHTSPTSSTSVLNTPDLSLDLTDCSDLANVGLTLPDTPPISSNSSSDPPSKCYKLNQIPNDSPVSDSSDNQDFPANPQESSRKGQKAPPNSWERFSRPAPLSHGRRRSVGSVGLASTTADVGSEGEGGKNEAQPVATSTKKDRRARRRSRQVSQPTDLSILDRSTKTPPRRVSYDASFVSSPGLNEESFISPADLVDSGSTRISRNERESSLEWDGGEENRSSLKDKDDSCSASPQELAEMHDRIQEFEKTIADLTRKLRSAQEELEQTVTDSENLTAEFQNRLEEMKAQLISKRKEEKELRGKERGYLDQIQTFEADVSKLHQMVEMSKSTYSTLMKSYNEQIAECESLRNSIRSQDVEFKAAQEVIDALENDTRRLEKEQIYLNQANELLLQDLSAARQAESCLEEQKVENLSLKETINRLRADLDNLRTMSAAGLNTVQGGQTQNGLETLGRSLEKELLKHMQDPSSEATLKDSIGSGSEPGLEVNDDEGFPVEALFAASRRQYQRGDFDKNLQIEDQTAVADQESTINQVTSQEEAPQMKVTTRTDEATMSGLPAYSPRTAESLSTEKPAQTSSIATSVNDSDASLSAVDESGWLTGIRQRQKKVRNVRLKSSFFADGEASPRPSLLLETDLWDFTKRHGRSIMTGVFLSGVTFYLGVAYADNQHPVGTNLQNVISGDASVWQYYNDLARAQGAGVGFNQVSWEQPSWLGYLGAIGIGAVDHVTRRVPT